MFWGQIWASSSSSKALVATDSLFVWPRLLHVERDLFVLLTSSNGFEITPAEIQLLRFVLTKAFEISEFRLF
ncbi:unnamed protein product [Caretta caretta]